MLWRDVVAVVGWMGWLAFLAVVTGGSVKQLGFKMWGVIPFDHFAHFVSYAVLAYLMSVLGARQRRLRWWRRHTIKVAIAWSIAYGGMMEWWQVYIPGRGPTWSDIQANAIGAVVGGLFFGVLVGNAYRFH